MTRGIGFVWPTDDEAPAAQVRDAPLFSVSLDWSAHEGFRKPSERRAFVRGLQTVSDCFAAGRDVSIDLHALMSELVRGNGGLAAEKLVGFFFGLDAVHRRLASDGVKLPSLKFDVDDLMRDPEKPATKVAVKELPPPAATESEITYDSDGNITRVVTRPAS